MEPQAGENFQEDTLVNKVVGTMTDQKSLVWVIKKIIGGLEMATSVECWSSMKEQKAEKEVADEKVMRSSSLQKDGR